MSANPADCAEPVCHSKVDMFKSNVLAGKKPKVPKDCPLDREELGRATWSTLHTMAAYYPEKPSNAMKEHARSFITALSQLYPCKYCAVDFQKNIELCPPKVDSRVDLSLWLCEQHNIVSKKLQKKPFNCTMEVLDKRWKVGPASCYGKEEPKKGKFDH
ncbi:augmenter of liver regeneration [Thraustotheca clavata]|uniref:Sulfhydryl oxidase n=1 Tax=Thraustotheca clavata TaxID=74557 RepID=A0A1V9YIW7_9STRA|nr:augmenter of liver regeneration [Thraustotheca clavata]